MAQIIAYKIVNGERRKRILYLKTVHTQLEIDNYRFSRFMVNWISPDDYDIEMELRFSPLEVSKNLNQTLRGS